MRARSAVIASVLTHAAALLIAAPSSGHRAAVPAAPVEEPRRGAEIAATDELVVELVELAPVRPGKPAAAPARTGQRAASNPAGARVVTSRAAIGSDEAAAPDGAPSGALAMRGQRHDLALSSAAIERVVGDGAPAVSPVVPSGKLERRGNQLVINDEVAMIKVNRDGTVDMRDKADFTIHIGLPSISQLRKLFAGRIADAFAEGPMFVPLIWGRLDVTAALMRQTGADPYASRKRKLLDDTRAERIEIGSRYRGEQRARSAELAHRNLEALWRDVTDPAARRTALFTLWDECAEDEAGLRARAMVIGWIGRHLPAGSADAYPAAELAQLDAARSSQAHFAPYAE